MNLYIKSISKRNEGEDKEKSLPVGYLGRIMSNHGEDFETDSEFGQCLIGASSILWLEQTANCLQALVVRTRRLQEFRRPTLSTRVRLGWSPWKDPLRR